MLADALKCLEKLADSRVEAVLAKCGLEVDVEAKAEKALEMARSVSSQVTRPAAGGVLQLSVSTDQKALGEQAKLPSLSTKYHARRS